MNIGRHNYEEFFILYMDNELNPAERRVVESFVQLHPDLKEELDLLMQFRMEPDESVVFAAKDELLKKPAVPAVNESNYNEWLLLYIDNELTSSEKSLVDQFLATDPLAQKEWNLLQNTRLQPETFIFADKSSLYRTEEKVRRIPLRWWRIAAAAVLLLGIGLTTAILINKKDNARDEIVNTNPGQQKDFQEIVAPKQAPLIADNNSILEKTNQPVLNTKQDQLVEVKKPSILVENKKPELLIPEKKIEELVVAIKEEMPTNNLPKPVDNIYSHQKNITNAVAEANLSGNLKLKQPLDVTNESASPYIKYASNNPETDESGLDQPESKKTKLRGLFRKVVRTFEKRTNIAATDDENKLLVAGLAFKLK